VGFKVSRWFCWGCWVASLVWCFLGCQRGGGECRGGGSHGVFQRRRGVGGGDTTPTRTPPGEKIPDWNANQTTKKRKMLGRARRESGATPKGRKGGVEGS